MKFFKGMKRGFAAFGHKMTVIINVVLLSIIYFLGIGLTALVARLTGKHFMDTKKKTSYWTPLNLKKRPLEEYYRQF